MWWIVVFLRHNGRLRHELNKCLTNGPLDVLMLEEHHLNASRVAKYGSSLLGMNF